MKPDIDSLVKGPVGFTGVVREARLVRVSPFGWIMGIDEQGHQLIMYQYEVIAPPRPVAARKDIPERFR